MEELFNLSAFQDILISLQCYRQKMRNNTLLASLYIHVSLGPLDTAFQLIFPKNKTALKLKDFIWEKQNMWLDHEFWVYKIHVLYF